MKKENLSKKAGYLIFARVVEFMAMMLVPIFVARTLTIGDFGLWKQFQLIFGTFLPFAAMGMTESIFYFFNREKEKRDKLVWYTWGILVFNGAVVGALLFLGKGYIPLLVNNREILPYINILIVCIFLFLSSLTLERILIAEDNIRLVTKTIIVLALCKVALIVFAALVFKSVFAVILSFLLWIIVRFLFVTLYMFYKYKLPLPVRGIDIVFGKKLLSYSIPLGLAVIPYVIFTSAHKYFVSYYFSPEIFAIYSVGATMELPFLMYVTDSVFSVLKPRFAMHQKEGNISTMVSVYRSSVRKLALIFFPAFMFVLIFSYEVIILLFSDKYAQAVPIFRIFLFLVPMSIFDLSIFLRSYGETGYILKLSACRTAIGILLFYAAARFFNITAVALSFVVVAIGTFVISLLKAGSLLKMRAKEFVPVRDLGKIAVINVFLGFFLVIFKKQSFCLNSMINLAVYGSIFFAAYFFIICKVKLLSDDEQKKIFQKIYYTIFKREKKSPQL